MRTAPLTAIAALLALSACGSNDRSGGEAPDNSAVTIDVPTPDETPAPDATATPEPSAHGSSQNSSKFTHNFDTEI